MELSPGFSLDAMDVEAPTERDWRVPDEDRRMPPGIAMSVLWWVEAEAEEG